MALHISRIWRRRLALSGGLWLLLGLLIGGFIGFRQAPHGIVVHGGNDGGPGCGLRQSSSKVAPSVDSVASAAAATAQISGKNSSHVAILDPVQIEKATVGRGTMTQLRRFMAKLQSGAPVTVGVLSDHSSEP